MKKWYVWPMLACMLIVLSACGGTKGDEADIESANNVQIEVPPVLNVQVEPEEQEVEEVIVEEVVYPFSQPFTGLGTEEEPTARPIMVMVENQAQARPQSGLDQADMVYEILAEGDITRFVAVYQSETPEVIGPVRSIRPYFVEIGDGLDAVIVHAGWSQEAMNMLSARNLPHLDQVYGDDAYYWRSSERNAPHNLYTSIAKIREGAEKKKFRTEWHDPMIQFADADTPVQGEPATTVKIPYINGYYVTYEFDSEVGQYDRYMLGEPHKDKETDIQLTAVNILVCKTSHQIVDNVGRRHINVTGPGSGYLIQNGVVREITWQSKDGIIRPMIDGEIVPLLPGKTWIHLVPMASEIEAS